MGRRDVEFWRRLAGQTGGPVLELGAGTGRVLVPIARDGVPIVGVDQSAPMLARARARVRRGRLTATGRLVRADIRTLPFGEAGFPLVMAPYGILQSLVRESDLTATLQSVARVIRPRGLFGMDLVPDLPEWDEYNRKLRLHGPRDASGRALMLVESVRQDRRRHLTIFDQEYTERNGTSAVKRRFSLTFRTLSVPQMARRLEKAGFEIAALLGDYDGGPWDRRAEVWIIVARPKP